MNGAYLVRAGRLRAIREAFWFDANIDADMSLAKFCRHHVSRLASRRRSRTSERVFSELFYAPRQSRCLWKTRGIRVFRRTQRADDPSRGLRLSKQQQGESRRPNERKAASAQSLQLWESRYIHPNYRHHLAADTAVPQVCPDVYDFAFLSERFASEIIAIMENFGQWSNGRNVDERLVGGYENVPTRDIHISFSSQVSMAPKVFSTVVAAACRPLCICARFLPHSKTQRQCARMQKKQKAHRAFLLIVEAQQKIANVFECWRSESWRNRFLKLRASRFEETRAFTAFFTRKCHDQEGAFGRFLVTRTASKHRKLELPAVAKEHYEKRRHFPLAFSLPLARLLRRLAFSLANFFEPLKSELKFVFVYMRQVGLHHQFLRVIDDYVAPMQEKLFYGYYQRVGEWRRAPKTRSLFAARQVGHDVCCGT